MVRVEAERSGHSAMGEEVELEVEPIREERPGGREREVGRPRLHGIGRIDREAKLSPDGIAGLLDDPPGAGMGEAVDRPAKRIARGEREGSPLKLHRGGGEPAGVGAEDRDPAGGGTASGGGVVVRGPEDVARPLGAFEDRRGTGATAADEDLGPGWGAFGLEQNRKWGGVHAGEHSGWLPRRASLCDTGRGACDESSPDSLAGK